MPLTSGLSGSAYVPNIHFAALVQDTTHASYIWAQWFCLCAQHTLCCTHTGHNTCLLHLDSVVLPVCRTYTLLHLYRTQHIPLTSELSGSACVPNIHFAALIQDTTHASYIWAQWFCLCAQHTLCCTHTGHNTCLLHLGSVVLPMCPTYTLLHSYRTQHVPSASRPILSFSGLTMWMFLITGM
jgi:hypothetical protein